MGGETLIHFSHSISNLEEEWSSTILHYVPVLLPMPSPSSEKEWEKCIRGGMKNQSSKQNVRSATTILSTSVKMCVARLFTLDLPVSIVHGAFITSILLPST
jgi:hypothetical protein